jgi:tripartite-type tricarboxylate transporter receptor subunit TctC
MRTTRWIVLAAATVSLAVSAQTFPAGNITLVVPFPPGGTNDVVARTLAIQLQQRLGKPVIVENKAGAGGNVGADYVAKARPDGHTLLLTAPGPLAINQSLYPKLGYNPATDFAYVINVASVPIILAASNNSKIKDVAELIKRAKAEPGKITYGSQGNGTTSHLTMELLRSSTGIDLVHVPYKGSGPATQALMGGEIDIMFDNSPTTLPPVKSGRIKGLAVASRKRMATAPELPTIDESGVKGFEAEAWFGVVAPAKTPPEVLDKLNAEINAALKDPALRAQLEKVGAEINGGTRAEFEAFAKSEAAKWGKIVKASGAKVD